MVHALTLERKYSDCQLVASVFEPLGEQSWQGVAGRHYTHVVYNLVGCPAPVSANWVLVRRAGDDHYEALATGFTQSEVASVNLAEIRHRAARLGANEVHLDQLSVDEGRHAAIASEIAQTEGLEHRVV